MGFRMKALLGFIFGAVILSMSNVTLAGPDVPTKAPNLNISTSRHNLTQSFLGATAVIMDTARNNYGEVCVYCHTPHGANTTISAPLWNRTKPQSTYKTYNQLGTSTITQPFDQPGRNSLTCLSCHDGTIAIDSIINMPGSGKFNQAQESAVDLGFLSTWTNPSGTQAGHQTMGNSGVGCMICHAQGVTGDLFPSAPDLSIVYIGTDLTNDHPVGVRFPTSSNNGRMYNPDFNVPVEIGKMAFFDGNGDGVAQPREVRLYDSGNGFRVECASCHDPHGVPGASGKLNPTFLRVSNNTPGATNPGSTLCLTCHTK